MAQKALMITVTNVPNTNPMAWQIRLGNVSLSSIKQLKEHIITLPPDTRIEIQNECRSLPGRPLLGSHEEMRDFEAWCKNQKINFKIRPSG